ncbi:MAG: AAA family ATPase [Candidatus Lokiarchaeota archaeon]|nr:AAA family ATPase [Candidatus Lokiarchaeota archaeon]MBD3198919.1 AAA family ATPase [Candidatus Lokiarchaeota archaeon]
MTKKTKIIAITGKGGSGKSVTTALMTKLLTEKYNKKLLLIDADPTHPHLSYLVNLIPERTIEDLRSEIIKSSMNQTLEVEEVARKIDFKIYDLIKETKKFGLIAIGQPRIEGCFCPLNSLLRSVIDSISKDYDFILIDCEAGLEQINRKVIKNVDIVLIISDMSVRGIETVRSITESAKTFTNCEYIGLILNKVKGSYDSLLEHITNLNLPVLGKIPEDEMISQFDLEGRALIQLPENTPSIISVRNIIEKLLNQKSNE